MTPNRDFNRLYTDVSDSISAAMAEIEGLNVEHEDGKKELDQMMQRLGEIRTRFDGELDLLERHAEWDKFTMAFFGETNAGKSTIIESLRILFEEDSRNLLLRQNAQDLEKYEASLVVHVNQVREGLNAIYAEYAAEIVAIKQGTAALARVLQEESSARMKRKLWLFAVGGLGLGCAVASTIAVLVGRLG